jgi:uncharacterized protein YndB with AHSA1/START domain
MSRTRVVRVIRAPRARVYRALLDPAEVPRWLHPDGMREVHAFEPRVGGRFRISLTYEDPGFAGRGKSGGATDTFSGRFVELVPDQRFGQWILETARAEYDQKWLDYQHEIGLRHERAKKNRTDDAASTDVVPFRYLFPLVFPVTFTLKPFLAKKGHPGGSRPAGSPSRACAGPPR